MIDTVRRWYRDVTSRTGEDSFAQIDLDYFLEDKSYGGTFEESLAIFQAVVAWSDEAADGFEVIFVVNLDDSMLLTAEIDLSTEMAKRWSRRNPPGLYVMSREDGYEAVEEYSKPLFGDQYEFVRPVDIYLRRWHDRTYLEGVDDPSWFSSIYFRSPPPRTVMEVPWG